MSETVQQIDPADLSVMQREMNKTLMVGWINADLMNRANLDVVKSVVLYDGDKDFVAAVAELPAEQTLQALRERTAVRFWSVGV